MLEEKILAEGPESVLAFIMEPIGGAATAALVAPDSYYPRIREICDRYGILLIHDEVMSGVGRTGKFLGGDHWNCRPDIVALSKGIGSGYAPLGAMAAPSAWSSRCSTCGGFQHGHTYAGNPLACAAGLAVLGEIDRLGLADNAAAMGEVLMSELREPGAALPVHRRRARQGAAARRSSSSPIRETMATLPPEVRIGQRAPRSRL